MQDRKGPNTNDMVIALVSFSAAFLSSIDPKARRRTEKKLRDRIYELRQEEAPHTPERFYDQKMVAEVLSWFLDSDSAQKPPIGFKVN